MPTMIAKQLNCTSTSSPTSACATRNTAAACTLTCPDGIGRERVRSTLHRCRDRPDRSRCSPRRASRWRRRATAQCARARPPGAVGDRRQRRRPPARQQQQPPADRPVEPGQPEIGLQPIRRAVIDPISGRIGDASGGVAHDRFTAAGRCRSGCRRCRARSSVEVSSAMIGPPSASLSVGPAAAAGAALHTLLRIWTVLAWFRLT